MTMLRNVSGSVSRWRVLAEVRRRRLVLAYAQRHQQQSPATPYHSEESLFSPSPPPPPSPSNLLPPTPAAQQVLSLLQYQPLLPALTESAFTPSAQNLASLLDQLHQYPHLALQTLIWSLRQPNFSSSPLLAPRLAALLPPPKPVSIDQFLSDAHAFWLHPDLPLPPSLLDPFLSLYCHASPSVDETLNVFNTMIRKGGKPGVQYYNQVLQSAVSKQHNQVDKAQWLFKHMCKNGPPPNVISYNILIYGYGEAGNATEALHLFDEMTANGFPANDSTYGSLISGVAKTGDLDKALQLLREMKYNGLRPSTETYALVLGGLCAKGIHQTASSLLNEMRTEGLSLDDRTYQALASSLCHALGVHEAEARRLLDGESYHAQGYFE